MAAEPACHTKAAGWPFLSAAAIVLVMVCLLIPQLVSRLYYQRATVDLRLDDFVHTPIDLAKARAWSGPWGFKNDIKRIDLAEGDLHIRLAETARTVTGFLEEMEKAEKLFRAAVAADSLDIDGYTGLARATSALEKVYPFVRKRPFPTSALPIFKQLLTLMPVNIYSHTLLTKYYLSKKMTDELHSIVGRTIILYPPLYYQLQRQTFYSASMNEMLKESLLKAIENKNFIESALKALADLALQEEDYPTAINYFLRTKPVESHKDTSGYYLYLGGLYLKAEQFSEAGQSFIAALETKDREDQLTKIWLKYKSQKSFNEFLSFCKIVDDERISPFLEILQAKCLIGMGQYELALSHLIRLDSEKYLAESLYLQAEIAEFQKDWDTMELRSQRATVVDPTNPKYFLLFSRALNSQKKWPQAEKAASEAIHLTVHSDTPDPWLYNHRAWIRWSMKDFRGAQSDWQSAIDISPNNGWFHERMALVFEQGGNISAAIRYLNKAIALLPDEPRFKKKYDELVQKQKQ